MDPDHELLRRWADGEQAAGDALVQRHFPTVFRFLRNKVSSDDELHELAQKTFLGCLESFERFEGRAKFRTYLLTIARNNLVDHLRDAARVRSVSPDQLSVHRVEVAPGIGTLLALSAERQLLLLALRRLPIEMQVTLELYYWERLPVVEIAEVIAVPEGTVKSRLHRARSLLREIIEAMDADEDVRHQTASNLDDWAKGLRDVVGLPERGDEPEPD